jgi:hypothetical protein
MSRATRADPSRAMALTKAVRIRRPYRLGGGVRAAISRTTADNLLPHSCIFAGRKRAARRIFLCICDGRRRWQAPVPARGYVGGVGTGAARQGDDQHRSAQRLNANGREAFPRARYFISCRPGYRRAAIRVSMPSKTDRAFDCHTACVRNPDPSDLDSPTAVFHDLALCRRKAVTHKVEQFGREPRKEQGIGAAALSGIGKHFERPASSVAHCNADHTRRAKRSVVGTIPGVELPR